MTATDIIHIIGTIAFTLSGYLVGVRKRLDILGIWICALLTAIGGGLLRDVVVGRTPVVFVEYSGLLVVILTLLAAWLFKVQTTSGGCCLQSLCGPIRWVWWPLPLPVPKSVCCTI